MITAESFLDRLTEMPDVLELAPTIRCPTLFIRGDQEDPGTYPAEAFRQRSGGSCDVEIVPNCDHFYVRREAAICDLVAGWLARTLKLPRCQARLKIHVSALGRANPGGNHRPTGVASAVAQV